MLSGVFGFSLIFELFVLYYAWNLWLTNVDKRWVYFLLISLFLLHSADLSSHAWSDVLLGNFDVFWREIFGNFGFR